MIKSEEVIEVLDKIGDKIIEEKDYLTELDLSLSIHHCH